MKKKTRLRIQFGFISLVVVSLAVYGLTIISNPTDSQVSLDEWTLSDVPADWIEIMPGLELRQMAVQEIATLFVRADLKLMNLDLLYSTNEPLTVADWRTSTDALFVVNAGFFEADYSSSGVMLIDDAVYGESYTLRGNADRLNSGMFVLEGDRAAIYPIGDGPLPLSAKMDIGLESFPMLISDDAPGEFRLPDRTARRTSIALDDQGRVVFIVLYDDLSLYDFRDGLLDISEELSLVSVLNLDGGVSTGISMLAGETFLEMDSNREISSVFTLSP